MSGLPTTRSWGLTVPGRTQTPSEGHAQSYARVGPADTQALLIFDNGTCLSFGPDDPVDEFAPGVHPFGDQILLIDKAIRDCKSERVRHEGSKTTGNEFDGFRSKRLPDEKVSVVTLESGTYIQVPSMHASVSNTPSVYSHPNKSDCFGRAHPGLTTDTRFGVVTGTTATDRPTQQNHTPRNRRNQRNTTRGVIGRRGGNGGNARTNGYTGYTNHAAHGTNVPQTPAATYQHDYPTRTTTPTSTVSARLTHWETPILNAAGLVSGARPSSTVPNVENMFAPTRPRRSSSAVNLGGRYFEL